MGPSLTLVALLALWHYPALAANTTRVRPPATPHRWSWPWTSTDWKPRPAPGTSRPPWSDRLHTSPRAVPPSVTSPGFVSPALTSPALSLSSVPSPSPSSSSESPSKSKRNVAERDANGRWRMDARTNGEWQRRIQRINFAKMWKLSKDKKRRKKVWHQRRNKPYKADWKNKKRTQKEMQKNKMRYKLKKRMKNMKNKNKKKRKVVQSNTKPNIVYFLVDDLGYNDVPWHNPDVRAPEMLRLARKGIILENHYVHHICSPSRAALLTGLYPFRYGRQTSHESLSPTGLNTSLTLLPQRLKGLGYHTHLLGKWHLGYCSWDYTPTARGFDSFYGFYLGSQDYYTQFRQLGPKRGSPFSPWTDNVMSLHDADEEDDDIIKELWGGEEEGGGGGGGGRGRSSRPKDGGYDFRSNETPLRNVSGTYSNDLYTARALDLIKQHAHSHAHDPLFLMLSLQAVHGPVSVPLEYRRQYQYVKNLARRTFLGMVSALDEVVGRVVRQLKASGLYDNTIIVFTTDNGGNIRAGGNNFPLRGNKAGVFEGSTKGVAFIHSKLLPKAGFKYDGMMHIVDWQETLLRAVTSSEATPPQPGGPSASNRVHRASRGYEAEDDLEDWEDEDAGAGGLGGDGMNLWDAITTNAESPRTSFVYNVRKNPLRGALRRKHWKLVVGGGGRYDGWIPPHDVTGLPQPGQKSQNLQWPNCCHSWHSNMPMNNVVLYNLREDPLETTDVSKMYPRVTATLLSRLKRYAAQSIHPHTPRPDPRGHPMLHGGFFSPGWCTPIV